MYLWVIYIMVVFATSGMLIMPIALLGFLICNKINVLIYIYFFLNPKIISFVRF